MKLVKHFWEIVVKLSKWVLTTAIFGLPLGFFVLFLMLSIFPEISVNSGFHWAIVIGIAILHGLPPHIERPLVDDKLGPFWSIVTDLLACLVTAIIIFGAILLFTHFLMPTTYGLIILMGNKIFLGLFAMNIPRHALDVGWVWFRKKLG